MRQIKALSLTHGRTPFGQFYYSEQPDGCALCEGDTNSSPIACLASENQFDSVL